MNNREIKFRVWDKNNMVMMIDREDLSITGNGLVLFDWGNEAPKERYERIESFVVMQFTGLLDKNSKEVYEGDILMYPDTESEEVDVGIGMQKVAEIHINNFFPVEFKDGEFGIEINKNSEFLDKGWYSLGTLFRDRDAQDNFEIIGNIYEDPELLVENKL